MDYTYSNINSSSVNEDYLKQMERNSQLFEEKMKKLNRYQYSELYQPEVIHPSKTDNENNEIIINLVKDKYGNYVIQKMIEVAEKGDKEKIVKKIVNSQTMKKRDGFSKHVMNFIEKLGFGSALNK